MRTLPALTDPVYHEPGQLNAFERWMLGYMNDRKDLPFLRLLSFIHLTVLPMAILLYTPLLTGVWWWLLYAVYFFVSGIRLRGPFGLMYHNLAHRRFFKKKYDWANRYITWFITPFFGHSPESYVSHHIGMHHVENNAADDASSTLYYDRDNVGHFLRYYLRFITLGFVDTFIYLFTRKRRKYYVPLGWGEISFVAFCIGMCFVNLKATLMIFIIPFFVGRLIMMLGNWTQHAFADPADPDNMYRNCYNCINTTYNQKCWNDGYHLIHHLKPGLHYTEMPKEFLRIQDRMAAEKTLVFDGIHYLHLFAWLMTKRYDRMADHLVNLQNSFESKEEAMRILRERTRKVL
ncbi:MAG: fatty acid desaturase [Chitinophagaceae bacterium]|jgi:fatty acid desaturase|nr:fatty acid desaturase [Chitinophagaceae bacterium]